MIGLLCAAVMGVHEFMIGLMCAAVMGVQKFMIGLLCAVVMGCTGLYDRPIVCCNDGVYMNL